MKINNLNQIANLIHCSQPNHIVQFNKVCVDSRLIQPGDLFWALNGNKTDGHVFLHEAAAKGAVAAIISKNYRGSCPQIPLLQVENTLAALQLSAKQVLDQRKTRIIAVTGSLGKTTTKEMIKTLLSSKYAVFSSPGNSNSQIGLPASILNYTSGQEDILVLEMGMTEFGNITKLISIAPPEVALITQIFPVHIAGFSSIDDIGNAKSEIFLHPKTRLGLLPKELVNFNALSKRGDCYKMSFSTIDPEADYFLKEQRYIHAKYERTTIDLGSFNILGKHNYHNLLAATCIARYFNIPWEEISRLIPTIQLPDKRLQFVKHKGILFLNDSYNAAEASIKAALDVLPEPENNGNKVAVLGNMGELGKLSYETHLRVANYALERVDSAYCLGEECEPIVQAFQKAGKPCRLFLDRDELVKFLREVLKPSDVVLIKGSNSKQMWKVLEEF